ncbi:hypothetical protein RND81_02G228000 [Saponaria officinalis]|uniref:Uncharacterized protein n=1 Tax=Saponaria officinalis TaxID=3572 RepID=A0AAW1MX11_SAPOF
MEFLKLSRFKLQLRALISEIRDLRERERSSSEQLHLSIQRQKQLEEEFGRKLKELESELALSVELRQKLERQVSYLQNDNALLENKQKELNGTIQALLQSKEQFVTAYQESTYELRRSIETRDRKLKILSEKLKSHVLLFDSIEKEALSVKQAVDNVHHIVTEKEEVVSGLKRKFDRVSEVDKVFIAKISEMDTRLGKYKDELKRKDVVISELEAKLDAERSSRRSQSQIEELQIALSKKEAVIQNLELEKQFFLSNSEIQALDSEVRSLGSILEKLQHAFRDMNKDKKAFISIVESHEELVSPKEERCASPDEQINRLTTDLPKYSQHNQCDTHTVVEAEKNAPVSHAEEASKSLAVGIEPACSITYSACSEPESTTDAQSMFIISEAKIP